ncbi:glycosyltransferase family 2 protein [Kaistella daneshvariae]|uniref:Glycosyltransferase involved in cell wall bisynthesis n=2 Tax=Kaistella TaxID=2782231 RepID=A0A1I3NKP8_9FLAO|nr:MULTISPECIES: glycosyltransferase family A protein [Kaistella]AZI66584.1 glycosyltransferase family 2 protein [Kaistella daneshvariae]SFJ09737.1 Glycosyltransferase involved in cell wall bisynthesis [Kaistella treverensis]
MSPIVPKYSIIVPAFNAESTIKICVGSILKQTCKAFEIIIVNDGSTDNTYATLEQLAKVDRRIILISKQNGGVASARNLGITMARGNYILFVDSDDYLESRFLETYDDLLRITPDALIYQSFTSQYKDRTIRETLPNQLYSKDQMPACLVLLEKKRCIGGACNKIFNAKIINDNKIRFNPQLHYGEDKIFTLQYMQFVYQIVLSDRCYYNYNRISENSLSKKHHPYKELLLFIEKEYELYKKLLLRFPNEQLKKIINTRYSSFSKYVLLSMYRKHDRATLEERSQLRRSIIKFDRCNLRIKEYEIEVPAIVNTIYKSDTLMMLSMALRTSFSTIYQIIRN